MSKKKLAEAQSKIETLMHANVQLAQRVVAMEKAYQKSAERVVATEKAYLILSKHNDGLLLHINEMGTPKLKLSLWKRIGKWMKRKHCMNVSSS